MKHNMNNILYFVISIALSINQPIKNRGFKYFSFIIIHLNEKNQGLFSR